MIILDTTTTIIFIALIFNILLIRHLGSKLNKINNTINKHNEMLKKLNKRMKNNDIVTSFNTSASSLSIDVIYSWGDDTIRDEISKIIYEYNQKVKEHYDTKELQ